MAQTVLLEIVDGVATLTLNRPAVFNALDPSMATELPQVLDQVTNDTAVRCVVIRGAGGQFMAGGDIAYFGKCLQLDDSEREVTVSKVIKDVHWAIGLIRQMRKPVVAAVEGAAAGFGLSLVAACDLAIAADDSIFTLAYRHIGVSPDGGSTWFLPRLVGMKRAMELALLGDRFDAARALEVGLVNQVVPANQLEAALGKLTKQLVHGPAHAMANTKQLINQSLSSDLAQQLLAEEESFIECSGTADFAEGVTAFGEKRAPRFGA